ncbi:TetR/AcrR family transcriptional regulator [Streptomyces sp. N2-109]|uniref:TetR/AcrR family transcriptional regulator n=1 Tax=Streptomyces gossypii TaxID=2883101 RepID=A0ABT2JPJ4_9ACTN|nr:TetR/AcrR family transcriptional regulator [Streptomyces gossypii]MCT2589790.1 TetR/AcrR family transcriptional regulator [Streptomyces gossypii]
MSKAHGSRNGGAPGRPRDAHIDAAVLAATLEVLDEKGYAGLSLEEVAGRAGTSRPTIYRRWAGRAPLVLAAIAARLDVPAPPDSGCTLCDLAESFNVFLAAYRTIRPDVLASLYSDCARDPELRDCFLGTLIEPSRRAVGRTLDQAIARGDLRAETDREQLLDLLGALVHYRALFGREHLTDSEAERAIQTLLRGVAVDYPALVAHSQALELEHAAPHGDHGEHGDHGDRTA